MTYIYISTKGWYAIIVKEYVNLTLPQIDMCQCEKCRLDIMSIMLNNLPPHYIVTAAGALFVKMKILETQHATDIITAMAMAVKVVKNNPKHKLINSGGVDYKTD